ncbi:hypothetical protein RB195_005559 [Necator americanus]|uniref:Chromo domain-containing protein n=2 Tax=Necator americanus TaxID=51031 RepID=A0ABR1BNG4_NECAM
MGKKNKSRSARRTGSPVGNDEEQSSEEYEVTEEVYEVECVVGHRMRRGGMEYKVRWRGWSEQFDEWLHHSKMDCPDAIKEYWNNLNHTKSEAKNSAEKEGAKKRERPSSRASSSTSNPSPLVKRSCPTYSDDEARPNCESTSLEIPVREATTNSLHVSSSSKKEEENTVKSNIATTEATQQHQASGLEDSASDGDSSPAIPSTSFAVDSHESPSVPVSSSPHSGFSFSVATTSSATDDRTPQTASVTSSVPSVPPLLIRKIPRPPAIPKRKITPSLPNTSTSATTPSSSGTTFEANSPSVSKTSEDSSSMQLNSQTVEKEEVPSSSDMHTNSSTPGTSDRAAEPPINKKQFVRQHGFERGLTVERIHGFIGRADKTFAVVQFKNCDIVEILATQILQHYEPLALVRGFEEHHIRCRRNEVLASPTKSSEGRL